MSICDAGRPRRGVKAHEWEGEGGRGVGGAKIQLSESTGIEESNMKVHFLLLQFPPPLPHPPRPILQMAAARRGYQHSLHSTTP